MGQYVRAMGEKKWARDKERKRETKVYLRLSQYKETKVFLRLSLIYEKKVS